MPQTNSSTALRSQIATSNIPPERIERRILIIRGHKVMLDTDLAELYEVETKFVNLAVRRNPERFPKDFMFQLTAQEHEVLRLQFATSNEGRGGRRYRPYAFTQEGVAMRSPVPQPLPLGAHEAEWLFQQEKAISTEA